MKKQYNKLVRDLIPEVIKKKGGNCRFEILSEHDYIERLEQKINEEVAEYQQDKSLDELADILEVIHAIVKYRGYTVGQLEAKRKEKANSRGSFDKRILLLEVDE